MITYIVTFLLTQPEKKYKSFFLALEKLGAVKVLPNGFFVRTDRNIEEMRVALIPYLNKADGLIVAAVSGEAAIRNSMCAPETLKKMLIKP
ncbi:MAG: hypothetical protein PHO15_04000 [Eubacteriales bacterium]|nr:hypothetical protein [Eubacteriales bacterium]